MPSNSLLRAGLALLICLTLSGCATRPQTLLSDAAEAAGRKGAAEVGVNLPPLDSSLTAITHHAPLIEGAETMVVLRREREQLDICNAKPAEFAAFYNRLRQDLREGSAK